MKDRFEVVYKENHSAGIVFVDKETSVNYLYVHRLWGRSDAATGC